LRNLYNRLDETEYEDSKEFLDHISASLLTPDRELNEQAKKAIFQLSNRMIMIPQALYSLLDMIMK
jgi:hypothetical protein